MRTRHSACKRYLLLVLIACVCLTAFPMTAKAEVYWPEGPQVESPSAIVMEIDTGTVLYEKNENEVNYPASITKILTALLAIENCDYGEVVTFSKEAIKNTPRDSSHISRDVGEQMTMEQCLYAIMLESANDCAYAVAEHVGRKLGGDYQTFIDLMNARAAELGCTNTHFTNANGLPDTDHYTSARDMALISAEAYRNENFRILTGTKTYQIPPTNKHTEITYLSNHHKMLHRYKDSKVVYEYCTGGKTGYTNAARYTLVTFAEKDGMKLVCVVMHTSSNGEWNDTRELFDYCFSNFTKEKIADFDAVVADENKNYGILNHYSSYVTMDTEASVVLPKTADFAQATGRVIPATEPGEVVARLEYSYGGRLIGAVDIVASGVNVGNDYFAKEDEVVSANGENIVIVRPMHILAAVLVLAVLVALFLLGKHVYDNYYVILHNMEVKRQRRERFRPSQATRKRRRRKDRMFR